MKVCYLQIQLAIIIYVPLVPLQLFDFHAEAFFSYVWQTCMSTACCNNNIILVLYQIGKLCNVIL